MSGMSVWQKKIELDISTAQKQLNALQEEVNNKEYKIDLNVNKEQLESVIKNLDKMLKSLGGGTGDFKQFENLSKELTAVTSEVKDLSTAFGKLDGNSGAKNILSSIQSIDSSLTTLTKHFTEVNNDIGNIGKNANTNAGQIQNAQKATEELANATKDLAKAQQQVKSSPIQNIDKENLSSGDNATSINQATHQRETSQTKLKDVINADNTGGLDELEAKIKTIFTDTTELEKVLTSLRDGTGFNLNWKDNESTESKVRQLNSVLKEYGYTIKNLNHSDDAFSSSGTITAIEQQASTMDNLAEQTERVALTYEETVNKAKQIKESLNLGDTWTIKVDSNELVTITQKLSDVNSSTTTVTQTFKSAQEAIDNFGKDASNVAEKTSVSMKAVKESTKDTAAPKVDTSALEEEKKKYEEVTRLIKEYKEVGTRINSGKALNDDVTKLDELKNKIDKIHNSDILSAEHLEKSKQQLIDIEKTLGIVKEKTEQSSINSMFSSLEKFQNKLYTLSLKPDSEHIFDSWKNQLDNLQVTIDRYKTTIESIRNNGGIVSKDDEYNVTKLETKIKNAITKMEHGITLGERGWTDSASVKTAEHLNKLLEQNSKMSKEAKAAIRAYYQECVNKNPSKALKEIETECYAIVQKEREAGRAGKSWFDILTNKAMYQNLASIAGMFFNVYTVINKLGEACETVRELDTALTEMRKVSDESLSSLKAYQKETFSTANDIGTTALDLQDATATWMRLGESLSEAKESAKDATILMNVSEFDNIDDATESLVAMSQAYQELDKMDIIDVLDNIGNKYSIATDELSTALQDSAAVLKTQGNDLYESAALITAGNAITQDASKTAGKTLPDIVRNYYIRTYLTALIA
jgi:hypothetical protein